MDSEVCNGTSQGAEETASGSEVLLRWGQRKRLRFARADGRVAGEESRVEVKRRCSTTLNGFISTESRVCDASGHVEDALHRSNVRPSSPWKSTGLRRSSDRVNGITIHQKRDSSLKVKNARLRSSQAWGNGCQSDMKGEDGGAASSPPDSTHTNHYKDGHSGAEVMNVNALESGIFRERRFIQQCLVAPELVELPRFLLSLSRSEKEDDFMAIKGSKLPQRPKRRSKHVEKSLMRLLPGAWLVNVSKEKYEVREGKKASKKKPRGLKAMSCGADSDSDD